MPKTVVMCIPSTVAACPEARPERLPRPGALARKRRRARAFGRTCIRTAQPRGTAGCACRGGRPAPTAVPAHGAGMVAAWLRGVTVRPPGLRGARACGRELGDGEAGGDGAVLHHVEAVGDARGEAEVLLDEEDGHAAGLERRQHLADAVDDDRREALGRLVEQQHLDAGAQDAGDGEHLLLAAGELGALAGAALGEVGEEREDLVERHAARRRPPAAASGSPAPSGVAKMPRSSGTKPMPAWAVRWRGRRIRSWPSKRRCRCACGRCP